MGLAGKDKVDPPVVSYQDACQCRDIIKDKICPFIGGKTSGKAHRENTRLQFYDFVQAGEVIGWINPGLNHLVAVLDKHIAYIVSQYAVIMSP